MPHDYNRDYSGKSIYPSVEAIRSFVPQWSDGRLHFTMDMHCPGIKGNYDEDIYFVGIENQANWKSLTRFSKILESAQSGPLMFSAANNLPFGKVWNTAKNFSQGKSCQTFCSEIPGITYAAALEIPYANASGKVVTPDKAKNFGRDLARAIRLFLINCPEFQSFAQ